MAIANASENDQYPHILPSLLSLLQRGGLKPLHIGEKKLLPIVQGGMGVGVSAHSLAGTVAACGGIGTIASVDLRHLHPDLAEQTRRARGETGKAQIEAANQEALRREIRVAKALSQGQPIRITSPLPSRRVLKHWSSARVCRWISPTWQPITRMSH